MDAVDSVVVESAAALARHLRQGRDRRLAVLEWFAEAGMAGRPGATSVPEPPIGAGEEGQDALYALAGRLLKPYRGAANPALVRAALESDEDIPVEDEAPDGRSMVHLVAAVGLGAHEVGTDALAEAFASFGMFGLSVEDWAQMLGAAERGEGSPVDWGLLEEHADVTGPVRRAGDEELVRARAVLVGLSGFYALYVMHGLLMPDTPALAALRQRIDDFGMFPFLGHRQNSVTRADLPLQGNQFPQCSRSFPTLRGRPGLRAGYPDRQVADVARQFRRCPPKQERAVRTTG
ncbi:hypothetical protein [Streptomyces sp. BK205]|uniref:hypothetical protein n=1 Tax=Streptomyces sp. BK205 TaxID=2512164 RepID=UPI001050729E|nr:hypothetical protein [Streptomyces sp. BK205]